MALLLSSVALAQTEEGIAQARFNKGRELFMKDQFGPALVELRAATALYESPNTRLYIARCERELGHVAAAYVELQRAASEAADRARTDPRYTSTHDVARQEASALESKLAHATIVFLGALPDGASITLNGAPVGPASIGVAAPIDPGAIEIVAKAPGFVTVRRHAQAAAGESVEIKIQLDKEVASTPETTTPAAPLVVVKASDSNEPPRERDEGPHAGHGLRNAGFAVGGIGIAGMGVFGAFAGLAQTRFDQLKNVCQGHCPQSYNSQIDEGQTFQLVANIALAAGGGLIVVGAIMIIAGVSTGASPLPPVHASFVPLAGGGWMAGFGHAF